MGEKLLAQRLIRLLRNTNGRSSRLGAALLDWARDQQDWLWPDLVFAEAEAEAIPVETGGWQMLAAPAPACASDTLSWDRLPALAEAIDTDEPVPVQFACVDTVSDLLDLDAFERELLRVCVGFDRFAALAAFRGRIFGLGADLIALVGRLAGAETAEAARRVRRSAPVTLGLLFVGGDYNNGSTDIGVDWRFAKVLDAGLSDADRLIEALAGIRQDAVLGPEDFAEQKDSFQLLVRLLSGALVRGAAGVNVLIYGPPGTGKTELARTLAAEAGATLYAVGECDPDGEEPSRQDRLSALRRAQRLLSQRGASVLLFDEMEDLFAEASLFAGRTERRTSSKVFVNRLLETNAVPTIWTSNAIEAGSGAPPADELHPPDGLPDAAGAGADRRARCRGRG